MSSRSTPGFSMQNAVRTAFEENLYFLSSLPPGRAQKWAALAVVLGTLTIGLIVAGPLSGVQLARVPAFLPMYLMAMFLNDLFTATLLFAQFAITRSLANLAIAAGYIFTAMTVIPYSLTFPGVFAPTPVIGGLQSTAWLFDLWHVGFPLFVIGYALLKGADPAKRFWRGTVPRAIIFSVAFTAAIVSATVILCIAGEKSSPIIILDNFRFSPLFPYYVVGPVVTACAAALIVLWTRQRTLLDLWLMVVLFLFLVEMPISYYPNPERFSLGWYTARVIGFFDSSILLIVLLYEITTLYSRLLRAIGAQRREREARLIAGDAVAATIAHEVKQPISGMMTCADAGLRFLNRPAPDLDEVKQAFNQIVIAGRRANDMIQSTRTMFKKEIRNRTSLDLNDLIWETLTLVRADTKKSGVLVEANLDIQLPRVVGDLIQLQQVLVNLITNAVDSMASVDGSRVLSIKSEISDNGDAGVSIADTGKGIEPHAIDRIFSPLFTTKSDGMGMGLLISRSIIEAHDGRLWVVPNSPRGVVFHFSIPPILA